ncbi:hypothetical protein B0T22DRAFT_471870 [Podospora appendiculata]|uniref:Hyaluronan/mRNA-binding protein domain-containing protein n=1 Tax=Podospora appendiculata TaxID=314037 RepID=A0AAE1C8D6_9PEZI|nr:hypothetical protein B0T22DRAFT_471870 [Podospora appendiculata]
MSVASKNLYELLGNDDGDSDAPSGPVKTVEKVSTHTVKRNTDGAAPAAAAKAPAATSARRGGAGGNDAAFRDRNAGSDRNRGKPTEDARNIPGPRGGAGARVRGGRGGRNPRTSEDRHTHKTGATGSEKQAALSWGATEGEAELKDEQAGEAIAKTEQKEAAAEATPEEVVEEEEEKQVSYTDYLAQVAEKKAALEAEAALKLRKANEGIKENKKWSNAVPLVKEDGEDYFAATGGKAQRTRERKAKQVVELENRFIEAPQQDRPRGGRGGRGGARGDAPTRGRGRGAPRGGDVRSSEPRAPRGRGAEKTLNPSDESAFPSLGS